MYCAVFQVLDKRNIVVALESGGIGEVELCEPMTDDVYSCLCKSHIFSPCVINLNGIIEWNSVKKKFVGVFISKDIA